MARADRDAVWQALNLSFYALAQLLEEAGVIDQDKLADEIGRVNEPGRPVLMDNIAGIVTTLRSRPFEPQAVVPQAVRLEVIQGGARSSPLASEPE